MKVKFFDPAKSYATLRDEILPEIDRVLSAGELILRQDVEKFEKNLAEFVGTKYAVSLSSGTDAIYLSLEALQLEGRKVALPSYTFKATCGAVIKAGAIPVIYDMDGSRDNIEIDAHIPVHLAGEISSFRISTSIPVIEDACQAIGAIKNPTTNAQSWSFYPAKILGAYGDAGAITTNDEKIADYIRNARNHFKKDNRDFGGNYRMDNLQAAILNVKFKYLPAYITRRKEIAEMYLKKLEGIVGLPNNQEERVWQDFIVKTEKRDELYEFLKENGIETLKNEYSFPPEYPKLPLAAKYEAETLRLPINETIEDLEVGYIIEKVKEFFQK